MDGRRTLSASGRSGRDRAGVHGESRSGPSGEVRHLPFGEADLDVPTFLEVVRDRGVRGTVIVESPGREADALWLRDTWRATLGQS